MLRMKYGAEKRESSVWFIRHGESEAFIGKAARHSEDVRLTDRGRRQAGEIAHMIPQPPDLIICSRYMRAWETAIPTLKRFPGTQCKSGPVQEFSYLGSLEGIYSTRDERRAKAEAYWQRCDPYYRDENGESFAHFIQRASKIIDMIKQPEGFTLIFTHEQFIRAVQGLLEGWLRDTPRAMWQFREKLLTEPLRCGAVESIEMTSYKSIKLEKAARRVFPGKHSYRRDYFSSSLYPAHAY